MKGRSFKLTDGESLFEVSDEFVLDNVSEKVSKRESD